MSGLKIYDDDVVDNIPDGLHRCRIISAIKTVSSSGNDMIRITLEVYGYYHTVKHYITFLPGRPEIASRNLRELFASCPGIEDEFVLCHWPGHECACYIDHDEYSGHRRAKISRFIPAAEQEDLPHFPKKGFSPFVFDAVVGEA